MKLYSFQRQTISNIKTSLLSGHKRILIQSPTGSGKTVIFSNIINNADKKNNKCLVLTDRIELLSGSENTLIKFGINTTNILKGAKIPPYRYNHCIAMSQTLRRRLNNPIWIEFIKSFNIVIIDEAHIQEFNIYFEKNVFNTNAYIFGFTATPKRLKKQRQLVSDYTKLIQGPQIQDLINEGFLVPDKYYAPKHFDVSDIKLNSFGEFKESDLFKKFEKKVSYDSIINNWKRLTNNTITLVFCVNIEHSMKVCKAFNDRGIKAKFIVSQVSAPKFDKDMTIEQFIRYKKLFSQIF
jgi:superfamily II DNA or RNA helicase